MNQIQLGRPHCSLVLIIVMLASALPVGAEEPSSPEALSLKLYFDGVVDVDYSVAVDPSLPLVNVSLFGWTFGSLIVRDGEGLLLEYSVHLGHLVVYTLGSDMVEIDYSTSDLTDKQGALWSLSLLTPMSVNVQLPRDATVISLSPSPLRIRTVDDRTSLTMPMGEVTVSYLQGVVGTKDHALVVQKEAEDAVEDFRDEGFEVEEADTLLQEAEEAIHEGRYVLAEEYSGDVKAWIDETRIASRDAMAALEAAAASISTAEYDGRTSSLDQARETLQAAHNLYDEGGFLEARSRAEQASIIAQLSTTAPWYTGIPVVPLLGSVATAPLIAAYLLRRRKSAPIAVTVEPSAPNIDINMILDEHPYLRMDDKEALTLVAENGGGIFASELRSHLGLPKSSCWRMIRRLEGEGVFETKKVGRETFVRISSRYLDPELLGPSFQMVPAGSYYQTHGSAMDGE
ncbi:MAG: hypothetical protein NWE88_09150 [Candidatus Bathyarchaeota archaeon]|nr:hypothetical protein [Candidatus Bathyarchaeota archaeon]